MPARSVLSRLRQLGWSRSLLRAEACVLLALASLAIALLPFRRLVAMLGRSGTAKPGDPRRQLLLADAVSAVEAAARRLPWKTVCFQKGVALHWVLRRRGIPSIVHYGVSQDGGKGLTAHVWVSAYGTNILGGEGADDYACLASFPAAPGATDPLRSGPA